MEFTLILKKLENQLSAEEKLEFDEWYRESKDHQFFFEKISADFSKENYVIDQERAFLKIKNKLIKKKTRSSNLNYAVAAIIIVALASSVFLKSLPDSLSEPSPSPESIVLTKTDGTEIDLTSVKAYKDKNVTGSGKHLKYIADSLATAEIGYNFLSIPRGKQFTIKLADNTTIWLNSDTKIKYPVTFKNDEPRLVEVLYGEAFFDVSPSSENNGMNFLVSTRNQTIEVLGTEFNIKSYREDSLIATTLAKGEIILSNRVNTQRHKLKSGFQSIFDPENLEWRVREVNVANEISWKKGVFTFKGKDLKDIMITVSRWYDTEVIFSDKSLENIKFNGVIRRTQSIKNILNILQETGKVRYKIVNKKITIKKIEDEG